MSESCPTVARMAHLRKKIAEYIESGGEENPQELLRELWIGRWRLMRPHSHQLALQAYWQRQAKKRNAHIRMHRAIPARVRAEVLSSGPCAYCGGPAEVVDHIIPVSRGGTKFRHNLAPACRRCNTDKSDLLLSPEHIAALRRRALNFSQEVA